MTESEIAKDYTDASNYVTDYYSVKEALVEDFADVARSAVFNFFLSSSVKEEKVDFDIYSVLAEVVLAVAPHFVLVQKGVDKFVKYAKKKVEYEILNDLDKNKMEAVAGVIVSTLEDKAKEGVKTLSSSDGFNDSAIRHYAVQAMSDANNLKNYLRGSIILEREILRLILSEVFDKDTSKRGQIKSLATKILGQKPSYDPSSLAYLGEQYELSLYRKFYEKKAYIEEITTYSMYGTINVTTNIVGMPDAVQKRILAIRHLTEIGYALGFFNLKKVQKRVSNIPVGV